MATVPTPAKPARAGPYPARVDPLGEAGSGNRIGLSSLIGFLLIGGALYVAREVLVPLALALLLSFALAPAVLLLRRLHLGRIPAIVIVVACAFAAIFAFGAAVTSQLGSLAENLPTYQRNIETKIRSLQGAFPGGGIIERASSMLRELNQELAQPQPTGGPGRTATGAGKANPVKPLPVEIWQPDPAPIQVIQNVLTPLLPPLATSGLILLLVIIMLLHREDLRDRLIRLAGAHDLHRTTQAMDDAGSRVSRYLLMQLMINAGYAVPIGIGLAVIGVPNPLLWGLLALVFRFVPYIGAVLAAIFPLALALAVDPGWSLLFWTAGLFATVELVTGNIVEPWLYGSSTGLSAVAIILAAVVWTWLWGPVGLLLSTPLTVCLVVLGRHVPQLEFLDVLLGNEAVLTPPERFYQRLLAGDPDEATEQAEDFLKEHPERLDFYDTVALPALGLAEYDRARGALAADRQELVADAILTVIDNLGDDVDAKDTVRQAGPEDGEDAGPHWREGTVLCVAARGSLDEAAASMLAQLLVARGGSARVVPSSTVGPRTLAALDLTGICVICLSYLNATSLAHARYLALRLRRRARGVRIVVGIWSLAPEDHRATGAIAGTGADAVATSLAEALEQIARLSGEPAAPASVTAETAALTDAVIATTG